MAQSVSHNRTPLVIQPFWEMPSSEPPPKWQSQLKLALLAKRSIIFDTLLYSPAVLVQISMEPILKTPFKDDKHARFAQN